MGEGWGRGWQMGSLGHYLLVGEVPQLLVPQSQDAGSFPGNLRVDVVIVGWALGELQETQRNVINYLTLTSPLNPRAVLHSPWNAGFQGPPSQPRCSRGRWSPASRRRRARTFALGHWQNESAGEFSAPEF